MHAFIQIHFHLVVYGNQKAWDKVNCVYFQVEYIFMECRRHEDFAEYSFYSSCRQ